MSEAIVKPKRSAKLVACLCLFSSISFAQVPTPTTMFKTPGMNFYSPTEFYGGAMGPMINDIIPESAVLNADVHPQTK